MPGCPAHDVALGITPAVDEAAPGAGGERPMLGTAGSAPDVTDAVAAPVAGTAAVEPGDSLLARLGRWIGAAFAVAAILLVGRRIVPVLARRRGGDAR